MSTDMSHDADSDQTLEPASVFVTKGNPTDEELGAVAVVLAAMTAKSGAHENEDRHQLRGWKSYWRVVRQPLVPGREVWRASLR